jgi:hypothetical protein
VASWEHLEFETRPDQLITYTLVQGDERVVLQFAPAPGADQEEPIQELLPFQVMPGYIQMELGAFDDDSSAERDLPPATDGGAGGPGEGGSAP